MCHTYLLSYKIVLNENRTVSDQRNFNMNGFESSKYLDYIGSVYFKTAKKKYVSMILRMTVTKLKYLSDRFH